MRADEISVLITMGRDSRTAGLPLEDVARMWLPASREDRCQPEEPPEP